MSDADRLRSRMAREEAIERALAEADRHIADLNRRYLGERVEATDVEAALVIQNSAIICMLKAILQAVR